MQRDFTNDEWSTDQAERETIALKIAAAVRKRNEAKARALRTPEAIAHREHQLLMERRRGR